MPVLKIHNPENDLATARETVDWLEAHGIPAGDAFSPAFVDTDEKVIYWSACVFSEDAVGYTVPETGAVMHGSILSKSKSLAKCGLTSVAVDHGPVAVLQKTPLQTPPPAAIVAKAGA